jgi:hypothetical protein
LRAALRITDRANGAGGLPATVEDFAFSLPVECSPTPDPDAGGTCALSTGVDALIANFAREGQRAVISAFSVQLLDQGPDGQFDPGPGPCPPQCGTGDERVLLEQGVFTP